MNQSTTSMPAPAFFVWRLMGYKPLLYIISGLPWIFYHTWPLIPGLLAKVFFDTLQGNAPAGFTLGTVIAWMAATGLARVAIVYYGSVGGLPFYTRVNGLLHRNIIARLLDGAGANLRPAGTPTNVGEMISTLRDDVHNIHEVIGWLPDALAGLLFAVGGIIILLKVDARITLLVFVPIVIVIIIAHAVRTRLERLRTQSRAATARVTGSIGEIFGAVQAIQVAGAETRMVAQLRRLGDERQHAMLQDQLQTLTLDAVFAVTANVGAGLTLLITAGELRSGTFSVGDFALFATYLMQVASFTGFLGFLITTYRQSDVAFQRMVALLFGAPATDLVAHHPVPLRGPLPALPTLIKMPSDRLERLEVKGLTLRYPDAAQGLADISFVLERGSLTVITGRVGAGKTTLLRALLGLLTPQAGEVCWNGQTITDPAHFLVPPRVAYTAQAPVLLSGTLRENILLGLPDESGRLAQALQSAVLEADVAGFADGLETMIGARGVKLSGGQIQRTAAARMFVRGGPQGAELLVFDDLSSALDVETELLLWQRVFALQTTYLVVSHRRPLLERADQILVMENGRITARGTFAELRKTHLEMQQLFARSTES